MAESKIYIGIDPSFTNTGIVAIVGDRIYGYEYKTPKIAGDDAGEQDRLATAVIGGRRWLDETLGEWWRKGGGAVGVEVPMGSHMGGASKVDRLFGFWIGIMRGGWGVIDRKTFTPSQIKKFYTGHGNADKELMVWFANNVWDFECTSHDIADAHAIAMMVKYIDEGKYEL